MFEVFVNPSRVSIAARIAQWQRRFRSRSDFTAVNDCETANLPLSWSEARMQTARWFWHL